MQLLQRQQQGGGAAADGGAWDAAEAGFAGSASDGAGPGGDGVCVVCLSAPSEMVYVKCGHMCCCSRCAATMSGGGKRCPVCRTEGNVIKVFRT
jgi:hypothetical protein